MHPESLNQADANLADASLVRRQVMDLMRDFSVETTPKGAIKTGDFRKHLQPGTRVYVTCLPGSELRDTIDTCKLLADQGMRPIPHFTARGIRSRTDLERALARASAEAGVTEVLALAGGDKQPLGEYPDTLTMLQTGLFEKFGIRTIGVAGHPEGNPDFEFAAQKDHGWRKAQFAQATGLDLYLVTQFVFQAAPVLDWLGRVRAGGNKLPVVFGVPGVASLKSLLGHARNCGVGASMGFLSRQAKNIHNLLRLQTPDRLVMDLAAYASEHPESLVRGIHMYPLGGLAPTAEWSYAAQRGEFDIHAR
jgi:methylenetetrahydrofolate reductase (NADPH)